MRVRRTSIPLFLISLCLLALGCSNEPKLYPLSGKVQYKGVPVKFGSIDFRSEDGATTGAQIVDGRFDVPAISGLPVGSYRVAISYPDPKIPPPTGNAPPGEALPNREMLPKKYNDQTELTAEVKAQAVNEITFDLK